MSDCRCQTVEHLVGHGRVEREIHRVFQQVTRSQRRGAAMGIIVLDHGEGTPLRGMKAGFGEVIDQCLRIGGEDRNEPVHVLGSMRSGNERIAESLNQSPSRADAAACRHIALIKTSAERLHERRRRPSADPVQEVGAGKPSGESLQHRVVARSQNVEGPHHQSERPRRRESVEQPELDQPTQLIDPALHRHPGGQTQHLVPNVVIAHPGEPAPDGRGSLDRAEAEEGDIAVGMASPLGPGIRLGAILDEERPVGVGRAAGCFSPDSGTEQMGVDHRPRSLVNQFCECSSLRFAAERVDVERDHLEAVGAGDRGHVGNRESREHDAVALLPTLSPDPEIEERAH